MTDRDIRLGDDDDLLIDGGDLQLVQGLDAVVQGVRIRLRFFRGEWFLDTTIGVPFFERVFIKNPNLAEVRELVRLAIVDTPDVIEARSIYLSSTPDRRLITGYSASTSFGTINKEETL